MRKLEREARKIPTARTEPLSEKSYVTPPDGWKASWVGKPIKVEGKKTFYDSVEINGQVRALNEAQLMY